MLPDKASHILSTGSTLALALSLLFCTLRVYAEDPDQDYSNLPLTNTASVQSTDSESQAARLSDLLKLKDSVSYILPPETDIQESDNGEQTDSSELPKKVFCNGFTGCGGPLRSRRRMKDPDTELRVLSKRPFCNSYGCYNSGRKRFGQTSSISKDDTLQVPRQKVTTFADGWPWARMKKLFCNGYGGCQNMGKRLKQFNPDVENQVSSDQRLPSPVSKVVHSSGGRKRFISSNFDEDFDSFIDSMRR
uniref:Ccap 1 n=1 Tax=Deroceras reticulatum TaxID=145610 RepID=A0A1X9WED2_DERRE|nr:ccap 1 [Deroceras reticulatum]